MNYVYKILARVMPASTVDRAVAGLAKFSAALLAAETAQNDRSIQIAGLIASLKDEQEDAENEARRAKRVRENIDNITA